MSAILSLLPEAPPPVLWNPLPTAPRTDAERFRLSLEAQLAAGNFTSEERNLRLMFDEAAEALRAAGAEVANPYEVGEFQGRLLPDMASLVQRALLPGASAVMRAAGAEERRRREMAWDAAVTRLREERPEEAERFLTVAEVRAMAERRARAAALAARAAEGFGGGLGGFAGTMAGIFADPLQLLTLPLGAGRLAGPVLRQMLRTAAIEGAVAGGTQAGVELRAAPYRQHLGLPDDAAEQVAMAALGGAVIGGGLRGLIAGVERLRARGPDAEAALAAARAEAQAAALRPGAAEQQAAHDAALAQAVGELLDGRPPSASLPPPVAPPPEAMRLVGLPEAELRAHVRQVVDELLAARSGARADGAWRPDLGAITIEWGTDRAGLAHIIARRNAEGLDGEAFAREMLPDVLLRGRVVEVQRRGGERVVLEHDGNRAVLRLDRDGTRENWLLTAFVTRHGGPDGAGGVPPSPPYAPPGRAIGQAPGAGPPAQDIAPAARRFNVYTPAGRAVLVEPRVVSLSRLVPSHDADGRLNPAYPHAEGVQPRDRSAAPSAEQVRQIIARFAPERLLPNREAGAGAPIVNPHDLVVESGNGRVMALLRIFRDPELAHLRNAYVQTLRRAGFDTAGIEDPVVVSARLTPLSPAERIAFVREANGRLAAAETVAETARRDADIAAAVLPLWRGGAVDAAANREFLRAFTARLPPEDLPGLMAKDGTALPALVQRVERALLQAAYGDALGPVLNRLLAGQTEGFRALAAALRNVAGDWAALRAEIAAGRVAPEQDATPALAEAVATIIEAQDRRLRVADLVAQADFERPPMTPAALELLAGMFPKRDLTRRLSPEPRLTAFLQGFLDRARAVPPGADMFGTPPATAAETLAVAGRAVAAAESGPHQLLLSQAEGRAATEQKAAKPTPAAAATPVRGGWPEAFPDVIAHGAHGLRRDPDWAAAKGGDAAAAQRLVERLARPEAAARLRDVLAGQDAVLVPVRQAETGSGSNLIPEAFARWLAAETGLAVNETIFRTNRARRTDADAFDRLVRRVAFTGTVEPGRAYVIVDDVVTQGGTAADLRGYIEANGGRVVAVTALQAPGSNAKLPNGTRQLAALRARFGEDAEAWWKETFGYDWSGLTASEAKQLFRFADAGELRDALAARLSASLQDGLDDGGRGAGDAGALSGGWKGGGGVFPRAQGGAGEGGAGEGGAAEGLRPPGRGLAEPPPRPPGGDPQAARLLDAEATRARAAALPEARAAELREAQRAAALDPALRVPDEAGERPAIELLAEAEQAAAEAAAAAACLIGGAA